MNSKQSADNAALMTELQRRLNQRGESLNDDGWGGAKTRAALDRRFPALASAPLLAPAPTQTLTTSERHYIFAKGYLGVREKAGRETNPQLVPMIALTPDWLDRDDSVTAWCGIFRGWIGHKCGTGLPPKHYRAAEWAKWGTAVPRDTPALWKRGDTVVMTRTGGNHVALLDRVEGQFIFCLGGNQNNEVNITRYALSRVTAVRR